MSMSLPGPLPLIRDAVPADRPAIVEFNRLLAAETEHKVLDPAILLPSVICHLPSVICHLSPPVRSLRRPRNLGFQPRLQLVIQLPGQIGMTGGDVPASSGSVTTL